MASALRSFELFLLGLSLACAVPQLIAKKKANAAASGSNELRRAAHAPNPLTFGALRMSSKKMGEGFPDKQMVKQVMDGKRPMPTAAAERAIYRVQITRMEVKREEKEQKKQGAAAVSAA